MHDPTPEDVIRADLVMADQYASVAEVRQAASVYRRLAQSWGALLRDDDWPEQFGAELRRQALQQASPLSREEGTTP